MFGIAASPCDHVPTACGGCETVFCDACGLTLAVAVPHILKTTGTCPDCLGFRPTPTAVADQDA